MLLTPFKPFLPKPTLSLKLIAVSERVSCGFPSPADDYLESPIDLNEHLIKKPSATFLVRAKGDSMMGSGIFENSILVVDRSLNIRNGLICVVRINDEFMVKRYFNTGYNIVLRADNPKYKDFIINPQEHDFEIWGIVRSIITEVL
jgi:DNA polymerase V